MAKTSDLQRAIDKVRYEIGVQQLVLNALVEAQRTKPPVRTRKVKTAAAPKAAV